MFDIGMGEVIVVLLIILLVTDPRDIPRIMKNIHTYYRKLRHIRDESHTFINSITAEEPKTIVGNDGKTYRAYDIQDLTSSDTSKHKDSMDNK